jgi:hypothetical protein
VAGITIDNNLPCPVRQKIVEGLETAVETLRRRPECHSMFRELGEDGFLVLSRTRVSMADARWRVKVCPRAHALTAVGSNRVLICRSFEDLSNLQAATVLLHEALHVAGRGEWPVDPRADTSSQISHEVAVRCGLSAGL